MISSSKTSTKKVKTEKKSRGGSTTFLPARPPRIGHAFTESEHKKLHDLLFALQKVSHALTAEVSIQKVLDDMAAHVAMALDAKWANFWELTPDKQSVYITAQHGMKPEYMEHSHRQPIRLGNGWIGRAVKTGKAWGSSDILKDPILLKDLGPQWKNAVKMQGYRALLCVPLTSGQAIVGGMCTYSVKPRTFTDFEMRFMMIAANQAATAITNAQIFGDLKAEQTKTLAMVDSLQDGLIMYDLEEKITAFNPRAEELLWISGANVLGKRTVDLPQKDIAWENLTAISSLAIADFETKDFVLSKPQKLSLKITQVPVRGQKSLKIGSMRILHDITAERETEELKTRFVSLASHQMRSPLSGIKWGLDGLKNGEFGALNKAQVKIIEKIYGSNEHLIVLVRDLLDAGRIEEGRFGYTFKPVQLLTLTNKIVASLEANIKSRHLIFNVQTPATPLPRINADEEKLEMAIQNIIENAVHYTQPTGSVAISFHVGAASLIMDVSDTGIGVPSDQKKLLFTKFFRARNALRLQTEGSGLGLWIANEIIKRHNGTILVESQENKGSTFSVQLPTNPKNMPQGIKS